MPIITASFLLLNRWSVFRSFVDEILESPVLVAIFPSRVIAAAECDDWSYR